MSTHATLENEVVRSLALIQRLYRYAKTVHIISAAAFPAAAESARHQLMFVEGSGAPASGAAPPMCFSTGVLNSKRLISPTIST